MAPNYEYLSASLPTLRMGDSPAISSDDFLGAMGVMVDIEQLGVLNETTLVPVPDPQDPVAREWNDFETDLRNHLVRARGARRKTNADNWLRPEGALSSDTERQVAEALELPTPEDTERRLDEIRWRFLENMTVGRELDFPRLLAYRIQLLIVEKWAALDAEKGLARLKEQGKALVDGLQRVQG